MQADLLHVVTAVANPLRWASRVRLYRDFEQHMLESGVRLTVVECAYGGERYGVFAHPGYAWAASRQALEWLGGLIETAALGAADHHMALALVGKVERSVPADLTAAYSRPLLAWQRRAQHHIAGNLGVVRGTIEHQWHGQKALRRYIERWDVLARHRFDPDADLRRNTHGVLELAGNKPALRRDIERYFRQRDEDSNTMEAA